MKNSFYIFKDAPEKISGDVLVFKSLYDWTAAAAHQCELEEITGEDPSQSDSDYIFVVSSCYPLISPQVICESFKLHEKSSFDATGISATEKDEFAAAWVSVSALEKPVYEYSGVEQILNELSKSGKKVGCFIDDETETLFSVNDTTDLYFANQAARLTVINRLIENGVIIMCDDSIIVSPDAQIESGATILPGSIIKGKSVIKSGATIGPQSVITNSVIGSGAVITASFITDSTVGEKTTIGPFTQLRPNSHVGDRVKIGDFVEIKNSTVGDETAVAHLTYVGDSDVGRKVNFGCGTVTVNYDGKNKSRTEIGDYAFIGCNTNLVAPVKIGKNAFTAAGSTITKDVPDDALCVSRAREQRIIDGWVIKKLGKRRYE